MPTPKTRLEKWLAKIAGESVDIEPKDRLETLLAKIAGDSVTITPDDSLEYWLNEIAEHASGGGGSSDFSTASVTFVADEGITLFGAKAGAYLVDDNQKYTAEDPTKFPVGVATTVPILDSIVLYDLVCLQDQSTPLSNVAFDLAGDAEFNLDNEIVITGDCVITVKNAQ